MLTRASLCARQVLDQTTGLIIARSLNAAGGPHDAAATQARLLSLASRLGLDASSLLSAEAALALPVVDIKDMSLFKAAMPMYPQGAAVGLLQWRRKQALVASKL